MSCADNDNFLQKIQIYNSRTKLQKKIQIYKSNAQKFTQDYINNTSFYAK